MTPRPVMRILRSTVAILAYSAVLTFGAVLTYGAVPTCGAVLTCGAVRAQGLLPDSARAYYRGLLDERRQIYPALEAEVFSALTRTRTPEETDATLFLLSTSPIADLADRGGDFFLSIAQAALRTRREMPWGKTIPDPIFLHFVLPPRVGSETIDSSRLVFPGMLLPHVAALGARAAVLEINHWCHERVTYAPSDARTRAPLATIRNAKGRCGEESVFTTTALRAAGIPARQVYVPRWAHADDNHAWVEAWVDGAWHFLGACEPEADLDRGWFAEPARRAMLTAALTPGRCPDVEHPLAVGRHFTRINTLPVYASTRMVTVRVVDDADSPVTGARVDFCVYNYAEFHAVASIPSDARGLASLRTGFGDLLVWAYQGTRNAVDLLARDRADTLRLVLSDQVRSGKHMELDIHPPAESASPIPDHPDAARTAARIRRGDSIRARYEATFVDSMHTARVARRWEYAVDSCWVLLSRARGNGAEILTFLEAARRIDRTRALGFLRTLSEKDLQDASAEVLLAHFTDAMVLYREGRGSDALSMDYVASPRIGREELRPWRGILRAATASHPMLGGPGDTNTRAPRIAAWIRDSVRIDTESNWAGVPIPIARTFALRRGDRYSRLLLFVALCRATGIPARLEPSSGAPEYHDGNRWVDAGIEHGVNPSTGHGRLVLRPRAGQRVSSPVYGQHFTLARLERGVYRSLDFENSPLFDRWPVEIPLPSGDYLLVTGNRQPDGSVLAAMTFLSLAADSTGIHDLIIRDDESRPQPLGRIDASLLPAGPEPARLFLWIERETEPVSHALRDLAAERQALGESAVTVLRAGAGLSADELHAIARRDLPPGSTVAADGAEALRAAVTATLQHSANVELPLIVLCDATGDITFVSRGYSIGVGTQIVRMLERMRAHD